MTCIRIVGIGRNIVSGNVFDDAHMSVTLTCVEPIKHSNRARYTVNIYGDDANPIYCNFIVDQINNVSLEKYDEAVFSVATLESWCVIQTTTTKGRSTVYCRPNQELLHHRTLPTYSNASFYSHGGASTTVHKCYTENEMDTMLLRTRITNDCTAYMNTYAARAHATYKGHVAYPRLRVPSAPTQLQNDIQNTDINHRQHVYISKWYTNELLLGMYVSREISNSNNDVGTVMQHGARL